MSFRFDQPWYFALLVLAVPTVILGLRWLPAMSLPRRWSAVLLRTALIALLAALLAGSSMVRTTDRLTVVAAIDTSGSVRRFFVPPPAPDGSSLNTPAAITGFLNAAAPSRRPDDLSALVAFDARATPIQPVGAAPFAAAFPQVTTDGTDIAGALRTAAAMIPPDSSGRIILFSDGVDTAGTPLFAVRAGASTGGGAGGVDGGGGGVGGVGALTSLSGSRGNIPVDVVPLNYRVADEVFIESFDSPPTAPADSTIPLRVVLTASSPAVGTLQVMREGEPVDITPDLPGNGLRLSLEPGPNVVQVNVPLGKGRVHRFDALWIPDSVVAEGGSARLSGDTVESNNRASAFTVSPGRGSVLLVDGVSGGDPSGPGATLARTLSGAGMDVKLIGPDSVQPDLLWLQAFDLVVLQNISADALPAPVHTALAAFVSDLGGGLIMVGGPDAFGAGGWKGSPVEPLLPVLLDLPEQLVVPAAAVVLVIDNSGSMNRPVLGSDLSQQEIACEGAAVAIESLDKSDLVGVITFNSVHRVEVPLGPNRDPKATSHLVRSIGADGGTYLPPALQEAARQLAQVQADVKHVIVLSDGVSQGKEMLPEIVQGMASRGIRVSTIAVGDGADTQVMSSMARQGGGRFYRVTDPTLLPRIFLKAVRVVRTPMIREVAFTPILPRTGSPVVEGLSGVPPLGGLVLTQARSEPTVMYPMLTPTGEPVLGYWNAGLGRVAAFTSDAHRWAEPWLTWPGYSRFWAQLARAIARPASDRSQTLAMDLEGDRLRIRLDAAGDDGRPLDRLSVPGVVYTPEGTRLPIRLSQIGSGQYETVVPASAAGTYVTTLMPRRVGESGPPLPPVIGGASRQTGLEFRRLQSDPITLQRIAQATGGRVLDLAHPESAALFRREGLTRAEARTPLWRTLAVCALVFMLLDIATRRVAWDRLFSRDFGADLRRSAAATVRDRSHQAAEAVRRLQQRGAGGGGSGGDRGSPAGDAHPDQHSAEPLPRDLHASPGAASGPAPLGDADAAAVALAQTQRRREAREAARRARPAPDSPPERGSAAPPPSPGTIPDDPPPTESALQAAKRRARERFDAQE